ncbi:MAG: HlyD family efflux transporter periplasmic adaptor subunit [Myxococcota bacterium]
MRTELRRALAAGVWFAAAGATVWLYAGQIENAPTLGYSEVIEVSVTPSVSGTLARSSLEVGQRVNADQVVGGLDPAAIEARIAFAKQESSRAEERADAQKQRLRGPQDRQRTALCEADPQRLRLELDRLIAEQSTERGEAETLSAEIERLRGLTEKQLVTGERLEQLLVRKSVLDRRISARGEQIQGHEACFGASATIESENAEERLRLLQHERAAHELRAPVSGTVSEILHRPGEWVAAGTPIARIVESRPARVVAYLPGRETPKVALGSTAALTPREHAGPSLVGKVVALGPRFERVPLRLSFIPTIPQWGRIATIELEGAGAALAGELYDVRFQP